MVAIPRFNALKTKRRHTICVLILVTSVTYTLAYKKLTVNILQRFKYLNSKTFSLPRSYYILIPVTPRVVITCFFFQEHPAFMLHNIPRIRVQSTDSISYVITYYYINFEIFSTRKRLIADPYIRYHIYIDCAIR